MPDYPVEQLKILHAEVDRQRDTNARRFANMHTRAAILIGASGVLGTLQVGVGWKSAAVIVSLVAAGHGLWALRPTKGRDADATKNTNQFLTKEPYAAEHRIVMDNIQGLSVDMSALESVRTVVARGYIFLVSGWVLSLAIDLLTPISVIKGVK